MSSFRAILVVGMLVFFAMGLYLLADGDGWCAAVSCLTALLCEWRARA